MVTTLIGVFILGLATLLIVSKRFWPSRQLGRIAARDKARQLPCYCELEKQPFELKTEGSLDLRANRSR
jgi:hypothetical protein